MKGNRTSGEDEKRQRLMMFSFDWNSSGFFPWRVPLLMVFAGIVMFFIFSSVTVEIDEINRHERYPASVFVVDKDYIARISDNFVKLPLTRRGPMWADPVKGGEGNELFFPLNAGLTTRSSLQIPVTTGFFAGLNNFDSFPALPVAGGEDDIPYIDKEDGDFVPVVDVWNEELEGFYYFDNWKPLFHDDMRGMETVFLVNVNERGVADSILMLKSSGTSHVDDSAWKVVRQMRWQPSAQSREGQISVDWNNREEEQDEVPY